MRINVLFKLFGAKVGKIRFFLVRKCVEDLLAPLANQAEKRMNASFLTFGICGRGPIEEAIFYRYAAVCGDESAEIMKQFGYVCVLFFEIFEVSVMYESVVMNKQPPKRICGNAVHNGV